MGKIECSICGNFFTHGQWKKLGKPLSKLSVAVGDELKERVDKFCSNECYMLGCIIDHVTMPVWNSPADVFKHLKEGHGIEIRRLME